MERYSPNPVSKIWKGLLKEKNIKYVDEYDLVGEI